MSDDILRFEVQGDLVADSPIHVGSGVRVQESVTKQKRDTSVKVDVQVSEMLLDADRKAYLPGSSLRGALRALFARSAGVSSKTIESVFGSRDRGGALWVGNAFQQAGAAAQSAMEVHVAVDRATGAADDAKLFHEQWLPIGTRFRMVLRGTRLSAEALEKICGLLVSLTSESGSPLRMGRKTSNGRGRVHIDPKSLVLKRCAASDVRGWLPRGGEAPSPCSFVPTGSSAPLESWAHGCEVKDVRGFSLLVTLNFDGPFLVIDPAYSGRARHGDGQVRGPVLTKDGKEVVLPAASFRGVLRAQAERIAETLAAAKPEAEARRWRSAVGRLFGDTNQRGRLEFCDFVGSLPGGETDEATMLGIDRHTGGVAKGRTFIVHYAAKPCLGGKMFVNSRAFGGSDEQAAAARLLLAFVLRDLRDGDLAFGHGTHRGFGFCRGVISLDAGCAAEVTPELLDVLSPVLERAAP